jgi:hypothetical protein
MLPWREASIFDSQLFSGEISILRRVHLRRRVNHQWESLIHVILQWDQLQREATHHRFIHVEGFSILSSQLASGEFLVIW